MIRTEANPFVYDGTVEEVLCRVRRSLTMVERAWQEIREQHPDVIESDDGDDAGFGEAVCELIWSARDTLDAVLRRLPVEATNLQIREAVQR